MSNEPEVIECPKCPTCGQDITETTTEETTETVFRAEHMWPGGPMVATQPDHEVITSQDVTAQPCGHDVTDVKLTWRISKGEEVGDQ